MQLEGLTPPATMGWQVRLADDNRSVAHQPAVRMSAGHLKRGQGVPSSSVAELRSELAGDWCYRDSGRLTELSVTMRSRWLVGDGARVLLQRRRSIVLKSQFCPLRHHRDVEAK